MTEAEKVQSMIEIGTRAVRDICMPLYSEQRDGYPVQTIGRGTVLASKALNSTTELRLLLMRGGQLLFQTWWTADEGNHGLQKTVMPAEALTEFAIRDVAWGVGKLLTAQRSRLSRQIENVKAQQMQLEQAS